jgi:YD repeat-containing protein
MMCQGAVRQCNLISRIDRQGAEHRYFWVANGIIRDVTVTVGDLTTIMDATVCATETTNILLGVKFLAQVDGVLWIHLLSWR